MPIRRKRHLALMGRLRSPAPFLPQVQHAGFRTKAAASRAIKCWILDAVEGGVLHAVEGGVLPGSYCFASARMTSVASCSVSLVCRSSSTVHFLFSMK